MKASKLIVLLGGLLGIVAFFLPMVTVERDGRQASLSAYQVMQGLDAIDGAVDKAGARAGVSKADYREAKEGIEGAKGVVAALFVPALLLTLIGGIALLRKRFGRGAAAFALVAGLLGLGVGGLLLAAAEGDFGIAMIMLTFTGLAGIVGGIMGLAKPERLAAAQPAFAPVTRMAA